MAGGVLLVASWIGWYASTASLGALRPRPAASAPAPDDVRIPGPAAVSAREAPASAGPLIPIFAELRDGTSLSDFLADQRAPSTIAFAISEHPPALLTTLLSAGLERGALLPTARAGPIADHVAAGPFRGAPVGHVRVPNGGGWVALFVGDATVEVVRISAGRTFVRFELDAAALHRVLGTPLT